MKPPSSHALRSGSKSATHSLNNAAKPPGSAAYLVVEPRLLHQLVRELTSSPP